jgi:DNA-binding transcriptional LysR family regulator
MNLQQLRYLVAAADAGSVSAAARAERVSQPVVSRALHDLEREYNVVLFRRTGRCLTLTEAGSTVVAAARAALAAIRDVERAARQAALGSELVVVATPTNSMLLSPLVTSFISHRPQTALRLRRAGDMEEVLHMVSAGEAELGFGEFATHTDHPGMSFEAIWLATVVMVSPMGTDLPTAVPWSAVAESRLVLPPPGSERRKLIEDAVAADGGNLPEPVLATDERSAWISSAQQGVGSFFCYESVAADFHGVEYRPFDPPLRIAVGFVHQSDALSSEGRELVRLGRAGTVPIGCDRLPTEAGTPERVASA